MGALAFTPRIASNPDFSQETTEHIFEKDASKDDPMNFVFPALTGSYAVGTTTRHIIDHNRKEPHNPSAQRELMIRLWYPAEKTDRQPLAKYINKASDSAKLLNSYLGISEADAKEWETVYTHAFQLQN